MAGHRTGSALVVGVATLILFAGCVGELPSASVPGASVPVESVPSNGPPPPPSPSQARVNVGAVALAALGDPAFSTAADACATVTDEGSITFLTGTFSARGPDVAIELSSGTGDEAEWHGVVSVGGRTYRRSDGGPWIVGPKRVGSARRPTLAEVFAGVGSLVDRGVVDRDQGPAHRLEPVGLAADALVIALGLADPGDAVEAAGVTVFADDAGQPVGLVARARIRASGATAFRAWTLTLSFTGRGEAKVGAPAGAWALVTSARWHYSVARPPKWTASFAASRDVFSSKTARRIEVEHRRDASATLKRLISASTGRVAQAYGVRPASSVSVVVGGVAARRLTYAVASQGIRFRLVEVVLVRRGVAWTIRWFGPAGTGTEDTLTFDIFLSTFRF